VLSLILLAFTTGMPTIREDALQTRTYFTRPISINTSGIAFQNVRVEMPSGPIALTSIKADLVDADNNSVPLSVAYFHHWFISVTRNNSNSLNSKTEVAHYGAGSEIRHAPDTYPDGYAAYFEGNEDWTAQVHLIDLRSTDPAERIPCMECRRRESCKDGSCIDPKLWWNPKTHGMYETYSGGIYACNWNEDRSTSGSEFCTKHRAVGEQRSYRLKYTIAYAPVQGQPEEQPWISTHGVSLKAESPYAEYDVPSCVNQTDNPMCIHAKESEWTFANGIFNCSSCPQYDFAVAPGRPQNNHMAMPFRNAGLIWATGHQHDGAMGIELWMTPPGGTEPKLLFESVPSYGSEEGVAGNEKGFLIAHSIKTWETPVPIRDGTKLKVVSKYDAHPPAYDLTGFKAGKETARTGVMGYFLMKVVDLDSMSHGVSAIYQAGSY